MPISKITETFLRNIKILLQFYVIKMKQKQKHWNDSDMQIHTACLLNVYAVGNIVHSEIIAAFNKVDGTLL